MLPTSRCAVLLLGLLLLARPSWAAEPGAAAQRFAEGQALLAKGDIDGASAALFDAARAAPDRADYVEKATLLRRVQALRRVAENAQDAPAAERAVASLHLFYLQHDLPGLAVAADRKAHERLPSGDTAARLAEALLAAGENADVTTVVAPYSASSARHATYHAIALARMGYTEQATRLIERAPLAEEAPPAERYDRARALAALGRTDEALALLVQCSERMPPAGLQTLRERAAKEKDFARLAALPAFSRALQTESKIPESCSGGTTCAGCPNRGACGGAKK